MTALPLLDESIAAAAEHCSYCPKLCRFACPVANETGRESVTPWGIDREITAAVHRGTVTAQTADAVYACTGCRACGSACLPGLDLPAHVRAARAAVVEAGIAPDGAAEAVGRERAADAALLTGATPGAELVVFPGCASDDGAALAALLTAAGVAWDVSHDAVCCGARSVDVGFAALGAEQAGRAKVALPAGGRLVVMDPHCARQLAIDLGEARVVTLPTLLAELAPALPLRGGDPVVWHDPCWLGRGMGEYDAARAVVRAATGHEAVEPEFTRDRTRCTGGGMGFAQVFPATADALRDTRVGDLRAVGADALPVVTACPNAAARLRAGGLDAHDLAGWLAGRLHTTEEAR